MNSVAWAPYLNNPYAVIGFAFFILYLVAKRFVDRDKFSKAYLIYLLGIAAVVIGAMLVILFNRGGASITGKENPTASVIQPASNDIQITGGSGNIAIGNNNAPVDIAISADKKP